MLRHQPPRRPVRLRCLRLLGQDIAVQQRSVFIAFKPEYVVELIRFAAIR